MSSMIARHCSEASALPPNICYWTYISPQALSVVVSLRHISTINCPCRFVVRTANGIAMRRPRAHVLGTESDVFAMRDALPLYASVSLGAAPTNQVCPMEPMTGDYLTGRSGGDSPVGFAAAASAGALSNREALRS